MRNGYAEYGIPVGYYDREGNPMPLMCWAKMMSTPYRFVAQTGFGPDHEAYVSTIWTGVPAPILAPVPYLIFATLVAGRASEMDGHQWRSSTLEGAIEMHDLVALSVAHELGYP